MASFCNVYQELIWAEVRFHGRCSMNVMSQLIDENCWLCQHQLMVTKNFEYEMNILHTSQCLCGILEFRIRLLVKVQKGIKLKFFTGSHKWNAYLFSMHIFLRQVSFQLYSWVSKKDRKFDQVRSCLVNILPMLLCTFDVELIFFSW